MIALDFWKDASAKLKDPMISDSQNSDHKTKKRTFIAIYSMILIYDVKIKKFRNLRF